MRPLDQLVITLAFIPLAAGCGRTEVRARSAHQWQLHESPAACHVCVGCVWCGRNQRERLCVPWAAVGSVSDQRCELLPYEEIPVVRLGFYSVSGLNHLERNPRVTGRSTDGRFDRFGTRFRQRSTRRAPVTCPHPDTGDPVQPLNWVGGMVPLYVDRAS